MIKYLQAKKEHTRKISQMIVETSFEYYEYLFSEMDLDICDFVYQEFLENSFTDDIDVGMHRDKIVSMVFSYDSKYHIIDQHMRDSFSGKILDGLKESYENVINDTLFLDSIFVSEDYRKKGIAKELLLMTFDKAKKNGFKGVSLFTLTKNENAVNLYKSFGFKIENTFRLIPSEKAYLFYKPI
ncbi:MAG: GNAT family N-acetyltransferase [Desulfobacterales bacterium]|nr:GNAT family N-acetyltransferase [Desulfobacterales bacterium]